MSEHLKEEHLLAVSAMMSSQLRRHCNIFCVFLLFFYATCSHGSPYSLVLSVHALTPYTFLL